MIREVYDLIESRRKSAEASQSYVAKLMSDAPDSILKKIGEESAEVIIAAKNRNRAELTHELCDLLFHSLVLMSHQEIHPEDILREMERRYGTSGFEEKKNRAAKN